MVICLGIWKSELFLIIPYYKIVKNVHHGAKLYFGYHPWLKNLHNSWWCYIAFKHFVTKWVTEYEVFLLIFKPVFVWIEEGLLQLMTFLSVFHQQDIKLTFTARYDIEREEEMEGEDESGNCFSGNYDLFLFECTGFHIQLTLFILQTQLVVYSKPGASGLWDQAGRFWLSLAQQTRGFFQRQKKVFHWMKITNREVNNWIS